MRGSPQKDLPADAADAVDAYRDGVSDTILAAYYGVSRDDVHGWVTAAGVPWRKHPLQENQTRLRRAAIAHAHNAARDWDTLVDTRACDTVTPSTGNDPTSRRRIDVAVDLLREFGVPVVAVFPYGRRPPLAGSDRHRWRLVGPPALMVVGAGGKLTRLSTAAAHWAGQAQSVTLAAFGMRDGLETIAGTLTDPWAWTGGRPGVVTFYGDPLIRDRCVEVPDLRHVTMAQDPAVAGVQVTRSSELVLGADVALGFADPRSDALFAGDTTSGRLTAWDDTMLVPALVGPASRTACTPPPAVVDLADYLDAMLSTVIDGLLAVNRSSTRPVRDVTGVDGKAVMDAWTVDNVTLPAVNGFPVDSIGHVSAQLLHGSRPGGDGPCSMFWFPWIRDMQERCAQRVPVALPGLVAWLATRRTATPLPVAVGEALAFAGHYRDQDRRAGAPSRDAETERAKEIWRTVLDYTEWDSGTQTAGEDWVALVNPTSLERWLQRIPPELAALLTLDTATWARHPNPQVRRWLTRNPALNDRAVQILADDPDPAVRADVTVWLTSAVLVGAC